MSARYIPIQTKIDVNTLFKSIAVFHLFALFIYVYTIPFKSCCFFKEINTFIQQGCIKLIKRDIFNVTKYFYLKKKTVLLNFVFVKES